MTTTREPTTTAGGRATRETVTAVWGRMAPPASVARAKLRDG